MTTEPPTEARDTEPSAESGEFESFFAQGELGAYEDGPARLVEQQAQVELEGAPLVSPEQLARRARLQRGVAVLVTSLGMASLALFATRGLHAPDSAIGERAAADVQPASVSAKAVSTSLGAARSQPPPVSTPPSESAVPESAGLAGSPSPAGVPAAAETAAESMAPAAKVHRPVVRALVAVRPGDPPRHPAAPFRTASAPTKGALARPGRASEPPTATFPVDSR